MQEYLEGDTLREPLKKGALPVEMALDLAGEICEALAAAHSDGERYQHREIYYSTLTGPGILVAKVAMEPFSASEPVDLSDIVMRYAANFDVASDGQRFLVTVPAGSGETGDTAPATPRINVVLNWFEELKQRVPTGR
ncbi:MAG: hypothetical protein ACE5HV_07210 [Acidobacteriota bacterium]